MSDRATSWFPWWREKSVFDRRMKIDPRYRDPNYPEFVCRRRKPYEYYLEPEKKKSHFFNKHPGRKFIVAGIAASVIVGLLFFFCFLSLYHVNTSEIHPIKRSVNYLLGFR